MGDYGGLVTSGGASAEDAMSLNEARESTRAPNWQTVFGVFWPENASGEWRPGSFGLY